MVKNKMVYLKSTRRDFLKLAQLLPLGLLSQLISVDQRLPSKNEKSPNILIIVFDALSARNMSLYGYPRQTTPNIEQAANEGGTIFHRHYASGSWTPPGTASLLTGTYPWSHRSLHSFGTVKNPFEYQNIFAQLNSQYNTFAYSHNEFVNVLLAQFHPHIDQLINRERLCLYSDHYSDKIFENNFITFSQAEEMLFWRRDGSPSASLLLSRIKRSNRLKVGIMLNQKYEKRFPRGIPNSILTHFTIEDVTKWIETQTQIEKQPFFGYIHLLPPHHPYNTRYDFIDKFVDHWQPIQKPESVFSEQFEQDTLNEQRRHYDEFIGYVDAEFGRLFDSLKSNGILDNTYLILTSDHGEMFERGILMHTTPTLYEPILHIPLIIWTPNESQRINFQTPTSCIDLIPTIANIMNKPIPNWCEGQVLPGLGGQIDKHRSIFAVDSKENSKYKPLNQGSIAHYTGPYKLTYYFGYDQSPNFFEFYNIETDPEELNNLYPQHPAAAKSMEKELLERLSNSNQQFQR